jgi:hypothetical protein
MMKLVSFYSLSIRLRQHCMACAAPLAQLLSQTYFMPFALTANAIVARIFAVISDMLPSLERSWTLMTVALARAPCHSSPPVESAAFFASALPALSAPLASVYDFAVLQLQNISLQRNSCENSVSSEFPIMFHSDLQIDHVNSSNSQIASFKRHDEDSGTSAFSQDDIGIPIGSSKRTMSSSKVLRKQKRPLESHLSILPSSLKKCADGTEFHCFNPDAILNPSTEEPLLKKSGQASSAVDDIFSALCGFNK